MILFIHKGFSSFVEHDYNILIKKFPVKIYHYHSPKGILLNIGKQIKIFFWLLINIHKASHIYIWFADYHSFFPIVFSKLFHKKAFIVLGGYDLADIPEMNYGSFANPFRAFCTKFSIKYAYLNLPVEDNLAKEANERVRTAKVKTLYTGYSQNEFYPTNGEKENIVLTVALCNSIQRLKLKGLDLFIEVAKELPEYKFIIIGLAENVQNYFENVPENLMIFDKLPREKLLKYYQQAKIYAQFSIREGLPNVICEAMLCECIPIGFNVGGIPIAIGQAGYILEDRNPKEVAHTIKRAMSTNSNLGKKARQRIIENFNQQKREKELINLLNNVFIQ